jgi:hypothetical protein
LRKLAYVFGVSVAAAVLVVASPFGGTWKLNASRSKFGAKAGPKEYTAVITEKGDIADVSIKLTNADGSPVSIRYTVAMTGGPAKFVEGARKGLALNFKRVDEGTLEGTYTIDGKQVGFSHLSVSSDGMLMRVDSTTTDAQGISNQATVFLDRQ